MRTVLLTLALMLAAASASAQEEPAPTPAPSAEPEPPPPPARPSIVVDAKDESGADVRSVTVFVDDKPVAYELDGQPIELDPGPHAIAVQRNEGPRGRMTTTVTLAAGDAGRAVHFVFPKPPPPPEELEPTTGPILPRVVAGVGIAGVVTGVVLLLARPTLPPTCNSDTYTCTKLPAESDAQAADDRKTAATNRDLLHAGVATVVAGAGVTAAGVFWYVLSTKKPRHAMVAPWLQATGGGLILRRRF